MPLRSPGARRRRPPSAAALLLLSLLAAAISPAACSVVVDAGDSQCATDADCERFGDYPACVEGVCVIADRNPPGCYPKEPAETSQFINHCTDSECMPYDNCARLGLCNGAALPPAVAPPEVP